MSLEQVINTAWGVALALRDKPQYPPQERISTTTLMGELSHEFFRDNEAAIIRFFFDREAKFVELDEQTQNAFMFLFDAAYIETIRRYEGKTPGEDAQIPLLDRELANNWREHNLEVSGWNKDMLTQAGNKLAQFVYTYGDTPQRLRGAYRQEIQGELQQIASFRAIA